MDAMASDSAGSACSEGAGEEEKAKLALHAPQISQQHSLLEYLLLFFIRDNFIIS